MRSLAFTGSFASRMGKRMKGMPKSRQADPNRSMRPLAPFMELTRKEAGHQGMAAKMASSSEESRLRGMVWRMTSSATSLGKSST